MTRIGRWVMVGTLALGGFAGSALANQKNEEHEKEHAHRKMTLDDLPAPVRSTLQREVKGGQLEELRSETSNGKTIYEAEVVSNGKGTDIAVSQDGNVLRRSAPHDEMTEHEQEHSP